MDEREQEKATSNEQQEVNKVAPTPLSPPPSHKKLIVGIVAIIVLVAGGIGVFNLAKEKQIYVPSWIIEKGNEYIIEKVGKSYFDTYYIFDIQTTKISTEIMRDYYNIDYGLIYAYTALDEIGGNNTQIELELDKEGNIVNASTNGIFDCVLESYLCVFTITKDEALAIAEGAGYDIEEYISIYITTGSSQNVGKGWVWYISQKIASDEQPSDTDCVKFRDMYIHVSQGNILGPTIETICVPPFFPHI